MIEKILLELINKKNKTMQEYYSVSKWIGPEIDDYQNIGDFKNREDVLLILNQAGNMSYTYFIELYDGNPNDYRSERIGSINGEELLIEPDMDFTFTE